MSNPKKTPAKRKPANTYKRSEPIPPGEILKDVGKKSWRLGPSIGAGGFGDIYSAAEVTDSPRKKTAQYPFVVKIEPHDNGPLFVEMHFYLRVCREDDMVAWQTQRQRPSLPIPRLLGWGSHDVRSLKHRFLVMERFGTDVWTLFTQNGRKMPPVTAARIAEQVLSALEYIHSKGYVHADVKGANLLLDASAPGRVVLVDFGLACLASAKADAKRAHNGTPEYASRDAHAGAMTMRGDLETLCLNAAQWLSGRLPWESRLADLAALHADKQKLLAKPATALLPACFPAKASPAPDWLCAWLRLLAAMDVNSAPDYAALRRAVRASAGFTDCGPLDFSSPAHAPTPVKRAAAKAQANGAEAAPAVALPARRAGLRVAAAKQNGQPAPSGRARKRPSESSEGSGIEDTPPPAAKNKRKAAPAAAAPSWRDGTAVANSNVTRPGEYQRVAK